MWYFKVLIILKDCDLDVELRIIICEAANYYFLVCSSKFSYVHDLSLDRRGQIGFYLKNLIISMNT